MGQVEDDGDVAEELAQGEDRPSSVRVGWARQRWAGLDPRARTALTAVVGVLVGAVAVVGFQKMSQHPPGRPAHRPTAVDTLPVSPTLLAQDVCTVLDGQELDVTFRVVNAGQQPVDLVAVRPDLPLGMLLIIKTDLDVGACGFGPPGPADGTLNPGESQPVTFRLLPLDSCPQPAPVAAAVDLAHATPATVSVPVLVDLGSVDFPGCATRAAQP
jgi:hypothetical protein